MCVKLPPGDLNFSPYPPHPISTYTYGLTIAPRVCGGLSSCGLCKVEFNQPSCWLYSVPNLLVFQQLETLYLCGNHVRMVCVRECEELLKCVQKSRDSQLDFAGDSRLQAAKLKHTCQACQKLKRRASCSLQNKSSRLARPFARNLNSQLNPVARSSRQNTLFGKI